MNYIEKLIAIPSVSGNEQKIQEYIVHDLKTFGIVPKKVGENVVAKITGKNNKKALLFNAHVDTVPEGNRKLWKSDPFVPTRVGDRLYGLGASDEKAGVASLLLLAQKLTTAKPMCDVWMHFVVHEEMDGSGTRETMQWFMKHYKNTYDEIAGILVEPTGLEEIQIGHKGNVFLELTTYGDSGHGSRPDLITTHAVFEMCKVFNRLKELEKSWDTYVDTLLGKATIGLATSIIAGDAHAPNKFPDTCKATVDIRTNEFVHKRVLGDVKAVLQNINVDVSLLYEPAGVGKTDANDRLVTITKKLFPSASVGISLGSTDQCFFTEMGIPALILGPGEKSCMHIPNEHCFIHKINIAEKQFFKIIQLWGK